jgi:hypothetical protein
MLSRTSRFNMARSKTSAQQTSESADSEQASPEPETSGRDALRAMVSGKSGQENVTKAAAARAAMRAGHSKPREAVVYIKRRFGIEMNAQHFSTIKSQLKKKRSKGRRSRTEEGGEVSPRPLARMPLAKASAHDPITDLEAVKRLIDKYGAAKVKRMVELLG